MTLKYTSLLFQQVRGAPPGSLGALKLFQYVESGRRGILWLPVVAQGKPSFLSMAAGQGKQFLSLNWGPEPD